MKRNGILRISSVISADSVVRVLRYSTAFACSEGSGNMEAIL